MTERFAIIAGGGTAGHLHPGLAVAKALVRRGHNPESLLFVGSEKGIEQRLVPEAGFPLITLPGTGIPRKIAKETGLAALALSKGMAQGVRIVRDEKPNVVLGLGGFASMPCAVGALTRRVPLVVQEQNAVPGAANKLVGKWAAACAVSYEGTKLPKAVLTGNPVREEMLRVDRVTQRDAARAELGVDPDRRLVVVFGGSLGALRLNQAALDAADHWSDRADLALHHVIGERDWTVLADRRESISGNLSYRAVRYEHRMPLVFAAADLVVCRSGASTTAELGVVGLPSVLIPLPGAPGDHQTANARALSSVGAATLVPDGEFDGPRLATEVEAILADPDRLIEMATQARSVGRRDAADRVADLLEEHAS